MSEYTIVAVSLLSGIVALIGWSLTNLSKTIEDLRGEKLSIREHNEFKEQSKDRWLSQAEINRQAIDAYMHAKSYSSWKEEFDLARERQDRFDQDLRKRIEKLEQRYISKEG